MNREFREYTEFMEQMQEPTTKEEKITDIVTTDISTSRAIKLINIMLRYIDSGNFEVLKNLYKDGLNKEVLAAIEKNTTLRANMTFIMSELLKYEQGQISNLTTATTDVEEAEVEVVQTTKVTTPAHKNPFIQPLV